MSSKQIVVDFLKFLLGSVPATWRRKDFQFWLSRHQSEEIAKMLEIFALVQVSRHWQTTVVGPADSQ